MIGDWRVGILGIGLGAGRKAAIMSMREVSVEVSVRVDMMARW
jgi:hypothetical protein